MEKIKVGTDFSGYPVPTVLVGAEVKGQANFMAVGWVTRVNMKPPMIAVGLNMDHYTPKGIEESGSFSVNVPGPDLLEKTDYCGIVSGRDVDKSSLFSVFYGDLGNAPMIQECPLCIECRLLEVYRLPSNGLFVGEVVAVYTEERYLTDGQPDIRKMKPFVLTSPDAYYCSVGERLGKAWNVGLSQNIS